MMNAVTRKSGELLSFSKEEDGLYIRQLTGITRISPISDQIFRISFTEDKSFPIQNRDFLQPSVSCTNWQVHTGEKQLILDTGSLSVHVSRSTGSLSFFRADGSAVFHERSSESRELESFDFYRPMLNEHSGIRTVETPDGVKQFIEHADMVYEKTLYHTALHMEFDDNEYLYGLGQSSDGTFLLRNTTQFLHQANMKIAIPVIISNRGYGLYFPTESPAVFQDTKNGALFRTYADSFLDYYLINGTCIDDVVSGFRSLTGQAVMLPKWAFGYLQSFERYESEQELLTVAEEFRRREIGLDALILDWLSWEDGMWGQKSRDKKRFPSPDTMMESLHKNHIHFMLSIWPNMTAGCMDNKQMQESGCLLSGCDTYNAYLPEARELYWKQAEEGWFRYGTDGWWCDSSEAFTPEWSHVEHQPQDFEMYTEFVSEAGKFLPPDQMNSFGLYHAKGIYENQRKAEKTKRIMNLTRSGSPGSQRYGTVLWSGDISASWTILKQQIAAGLSFCVTGMPYWTLDIGGFFIKRGAPWYWNGEYDTPSADYGYYELYTRWYQFGAFLPIFRSHGTDYRREPWQFEATGEAFYEAILAANRLRYRLMPYIYSLAGSVWMKHRTIMRLLAFDFPNDSIACSIDNQYMFGPFILVCPVTEPILYEAGSVPVSAQKEKMIYLPSGCDWYGFYSNRKYAGGQTISVPLTIDSIPLFIKAGAILPVTEPKGSTEQSAGEDITLLIYSGQDGAFDLYEDAGDGYEYENGEYALTRIIYEDTTKTVSLTTEGRKSYRLGRLLPHFITV